MAATGMHENVSILVTNSVILMAILVANCVYILTS